MQSVRFLKEPWLRPALIKQPAKIVAFTARSSLCRLPGQRESVSALHQVYVTAAATARWTVGQNLRHGHTQFPGVKLCKQQLLPCG